MKLTSYSITWYTLSVAWALFATRSSTVLGMASDADAHPSSLDSEDDLDMSLSLRRVQTFNGRVTGFELVDTTNIPNVLWTRLYQGAGEFVVYGANRPFSIKARVAGEGIGSVVMALDTAPVRVESLAPYALCGDDGVNLFSCGTSVYGPHVISAKACSGANGKGVCSAVVPFQFRILPGDAIVVAPQPSTFTGYVTGFELFDVSSKPNQLWKTLYNSFGYVFDSEVANGPNRLYSIKANVAGNGIGSVVMQLQDYPVRYENGAPYALCGDNGVDLTSCGMSYYGLYTIRAKVCSGTNGNGICSDWVKTNFSIQP
jgi:hypothetical protein